MSVTPNLCCDEAEPRSIHSPDKQIQMGYIYTMQLYSETKKDEIMPFPVVEKKPEMIVLSEVRQRQTAIIEHHLWWNLKMDNQS